MEWHESLGRRPGGQSSGGDTNPDRPYWMGYAGMALAILGVFIALIVVLGLMVTGDTRTGGSEVAVVRNGGWLDSKDIRSVLGTAQSYSLQGIYSDVHPYIAGNSQRYYTISPDPEKGDETGVDYVEVPTKDGVQVRLDGTLYFHTGFTDPTGAHVNSDLLKKFDTEYGLRTFEGSHPYDGTEGWQKFLDVIVRPVIDNTIREEIGQFNCADLVSSCALIQSQGQVDLTKVNGEQNTENFQAVQDAIQNQLATVINSSLGAPYLNDIKFRLAGVKLPVNVQQSIDNAQASFADIAKAQAEQKQSQFEAQRLANLAAQYAKSPGLATIDAVKAVPNGSTVILNSGGAGAGVVVQPKP